MDLLLPMMASSKKDGTLYEQAEYNLTIDFVQVCFYDCIKKFEFVGEKRKENNRKKLINEKIRLN